MLILIVRACDPFFKTFCIRSNTLMFRWWLPASKMFDSLIDSSIKLSRTRIIFCRDSSFSDDGMPWWNWVLAPSALGHHSFYAIEINKTKLHQLQVESVRYVCPIRAHSELFCPIAKNPPSSCRTDWKISLFELKPDHSVNFASSGSVSLICNEQLLGNTVSFKLSAGSRNCLIDGW